MYVFLGLLAGLIGLACRWIVTTRDPGSASTTLLSVQPVNEDGNMFLEVTNAGTRREFIARLELLSGTNQVQHGRAVVNFENHAAYWQRSGGPGTSLGRGERDRIVIGRIEAGPAELPASSVIRMSFWDEFNKRADEYASTGWLDKQYQTDAPRLELRVTVSATTKAPGASYTNTFVVNGADPRALRDEKIFTTDYTGINVRHF